MNQNTKKTLQQAMALVSIVPLLLSVTGDSMATADIGNPPYPAHCNSDSNCQDTNACTVDRCEQGRNSDQTVQLRCTHSAVNTNDNNACTIDSCDSTTGVHHTPITCPAPADGCHIQGACQAYTWQTQPAPVPVCGNPPRCTWFGYNTPKTYCTTPIAPNGTACNDGNPATLNDNCQSGVCAGTILPATCAAYKASHPGAINGTYNLNVAGHQVGIYCYNMSGTPKEYLPLAKTGSGYNYSTYAPSQITSYTKVRFHPDTLTVDLADATFATNVGTNVQNIATIPWATAQDCIGGYSHAGAANVDLTGTAFALAPAQFITQGYQQAGSVSYGSLNKIANLTGGGYCGMTSTANYGATPLQLVYQP